MMSRASMGKQIATAPAKKAACGCDGKKMAKGGKVKPKGKK
jgi:hypothetical protein